MRNFTVFIIAFISLMSLNLPEPKGILDSISFDHQSTSYSKLLYSVLHSNGFLTLASANETRMSTDFNHESYSTFFTLLLCSQKVFPLSCIGVNFFHPTLKKKVFTHCFSLLVYMLTRSKDVYHYPQDKLLSSERSNQPKN